MKSILNKGRLAGKETFGEPVPTAEREANERQDSQCPLVRAHQAVIRADAKLGAVGVDDRVVNHNKLRGSKVLIIQAKAALREAIRLIEEFEGIGTQVGKDDLKCRTLDI